MEFQSDLRRKEREALLRLRGASSRSRSRARGFTRGGSVSSSAVRHLHFDQSKDPHTSSRIGTGHMHSISGSSFYGRGNSSRCSNHEPAGNDDSGQCSYGSSTDERYWMPGDTIPTFIPDSPVASSTPAHSSAPLVQQNLADLFHGFQTGIETQLSSIVSSLDRVSERMTKLESQQLLLEKEVKEASKKVISSTSPRKPGKRRREVPTILQSKIRRVHASFDDEKQLDLSQPINSDFNTKVVDCIVKEIGTVEFNETLIRKGVTAHRKTLVAKGKTTGSPVKSKKRQRSRQQRSYERRGSAIKAGRESELWENITAEMMSEEEEDGDSYIRHPPSYRSESFNKFIDKLDQRLQSKHSKHPRLERRLGSPRNKLVPVQCKKWMVKTVNNEDQESTRSKDQSLEGTESDPALDTDLL